MKGFSGNIEKQTAENENFRKVLYTGKHLQLVLMSLKGGEEIGEEIHVGNDQFFRFESGKGQCVIDGSMFEISAGDVVIAPAGSKHNVINTQATVALKMYTIYGPPNHQDGTVHSLKKDATDSKERFTGRTTE
jgi:mannose-6-phosphate isomerase-like protein (cupin superfamily)